jgi:hypothetical protein
VSEEPHESFGVRLRGQVYELPLVNAKNTQISY